MINKLRRKIFWIIQVSLSIIILGIIILYSTSSYKNTITSSTMFMTSSRAQIWMLFRLLLVSRTIRNILQSQWINSENNIWKVRWIHSRSIRNMKLLWTITWTMVWFFRQVLFSVQRFPLSTTILSQRTGWNIIRFVITQNCVMYM